MKQLLNVKQKKTLFTQYEMGIWINIKMVTDHINHIYFLIGTKCIHIKTKNYMFFTVLKSILSIGVQIIL